MKKIIISLMLAFMIFISVSVTAADDSGAIKVTDASGYAGKTVKVDIVIDENPGMIASVMTVAYDADALTLTKVEDKEKLGENNHSDNLSSEEYYVSWFNPLSREDYTYEGNVVSLSFEIAEDAEVGEYPVTLTVKEAYNTELSEVSFVETAGTIKVVKKPSSDYIPGDINMDGEVDIEDALLLFRHSLNEDLYPVEYGGNMDFTGDGEVDIDDAVKVFRHSLNSELYPLD